MMLATESPMDTLRVFTTGGTIDKVYFDALSAYQIGDPAAANVFAAMRVEVPFEITPLMRKDSLELTDADRQVICNAVLQAAEKKILITHGTDTMEHTARALQQALGAQPDKRVVLTGSLLPGAFRDTDAIFNIGFALGALQVMSGGVRVAMNGRLFDPARVHKDREAGRFVDA
jgi:L-asparaginase